MVLIEQFRNIKIRVNARDHNPPHCHIEGNGGKARFDLVKMEYMESEGFTRKNLEEIRAAIELFLPEIWEAWRSFHEEEE